MNTAEIQQMAAKLGSETRLFSDGVRQLVIEFYACENGQKRLSEDYDRFLTSDDHDSAAAAANAAEEIEFRKKELLDMIRSRLEAETGRFKSEYCSLQKAITGRLSELDIEAQKIDDEATLLQQLQTDAECSVVAIDRLEHVGGLHRKAG